ncbi:MAG TPA: hypothetical protein VNY36_03015 [Bacteroidia bacterium]|nr:hypothetical protein [Bacteroidia bacterium]
MNRAVRTDITPLLFDFKEFNPKGLLLKKKYKSGKVSICLPDNLEFSYTPKPEERNLAKEIFVFIRDKRVLNSEECCDNCVKNAMESLTEIRKFIVEMERKLIYVNDINSPLYLLLEYAGSGIRQFLTFTQFYDPKENLFEYQDALNKIRLHLLNTFDAINLIGGITEKYGHRFSFNILEQDHIMIPDKYKHDSKIEKLYDLLKADGYLVNSKIEDFKALFYGNSIGTLEWHRIDRNGGYNEIIFLIMLLYMLPLDGQTNFNPVNVKPETILRILGYFKINGVLISSLKSVESMRSKYKTYIIAREQSKATDIPKSSDKLKDIVKTAFDIK